MTGPHPDLTPPPAPDAPSTVASEVASGLMATGISFVGLVIPVAHFVLGPLGPFLGALLASSRAPVTVRGRAIIGLTVGLMWAALVAGVLQVAVALSTDGQQLPEWVAEWLAPQRAGLVLGGVWMWATLLALGGAFLGGALRRSDASG